MKKIAFIIRMLQEKSFHGGGEKLFYNLIKRFSHRDILIDIYCSTSDVEKISGINKIVVINETYDHNKPETMEAFYEQAKKQTEKEGYDFVISENITPPVDITFLQGHSLVNRLKTTKNFIESFLYKFRKTKQKRIQYQKKWLKQGYRKIFAVSKILKKDIINNFKIDGDNIKVIYPGVDIPETEVALPDIKNKDILTFGLLAPGFKIKGGYIFLQALAVLKTHGYNFKAKIVYPKYSKNLGVQSNIKLYGLQDCVEFLPYQEEVRSFYESIDCLVVPSIEDTFNLAALEAMSCKRPCIISTNAGASEIIEDGKNGFVFKFSKNSPYNLADKMSQVINNKELLIFLSEEAYKTAKLHSWDKTFDEFFEELKSLEKVTS